MHRKRREARDPQATRQALLQAGAEMFAAAGYDGVRVEALARRAGVNKAMINYHFGGKRKLYEAIIQEALSAVASHLRALGGQDLPAPEMLRSFVRGFGQIATERLPNFPALVLRELLDAGRFSPKLTSHRKEVLGGLIAILERGMREGSLRRVDAKAACMNLIGGLAFFFATQPLQRRAFAPLGLGKPPSAESYVRYVEELLLLGLAARTGSQAPRGATR